MNNNDKKRVEQRIKPGWEKPHAAFSNQMHKRMKWGHREYGDRSFSRPLPALIVEIQEELLDTANWASVAWAKLERLLEKVREIEEGTS